MATKTATVPEADMMNYLTVLKAAIKELSEIRKANPATDAEIRRLQSSTRKKLGRIEENLRHVEAAR
ncbi:MAG TPA: hypothetical protein VI136_09305 [Verrucomicrobiae bacterium]